MTPWKSGDLQYMGCALWGASFFIRRSWDDVGWDVMKAYDTKKGVPPYSNLC